MRRKVVRWLAEQRNSLFHVRVGLAVQLLALSIEIGAGNYYLLYYQSNNTPCNNQCYILKEPSTYRYKAQVHLQESILSLYHSFYYYYPTNKSIFRQGALKPSNSNSVMEGLTQQKALNALEPYVLLSKSATSPRAAADLIMQAISAPNTYIFAEILQTPNIQSLRTASSEYAPYLTLLEIFSWGTWSDYTCTTPL